MGNFESGMEQQERKTMPCGYAEKTIPKLKEEGWEHEWNFHARDDQSWNDACKKVESLQRNGDWEVVLVKGQNELEIKDGVVYIYKRKTEQRKQ